MEIPPELFLSKIEEKKVYYFACDDFNTDIPHYFICIKRTENDLLYFTCCTSQFETVRRFIEVRRLPFTTLIFIDPEKTDDLFTKNTYINCNSCYTYSLEDLKKMLENRKIEFKGEIPFSYYEQIVLGLIDSPMIDEETKDIFRQIPL